MQLSRPTNPTQTRGRGGGGGTQTHPVCEGELDLAVVELLGVVTLAGRRGHRGGLDDLCV